MGKINSNITKASYMLKRLRDSGYKADKIVGVSDTKSLDMDLDKLLLKLFPSEKILKSEDVHQIVREFKTELIRCCYAVPNYSDMDARVWTILVDGGRDNIYLTFYNNSKDVNDKYEDLGDDFFEIYDGGQYVKPIRKRLNTHSFEVIVQVLNDLGVVKKFST